MFNTLSIPQRLQHILPLLSVLITIIHMNFITTAAWHLMNLTQPHTVLTLRAVIKESIGHNFNKINYEMPKCPHIWHSLSDGSI